MTIAEFVARWHKVATNREHVTQQHYTVMVRPFVLLHGGRGFDSVSRWEAQEWAAAHGGQVRYLRALWADAVRCGAARENAFAGVSRGATGRLDRTPPSGPMLDRIVSTANPWFREVVLVAAFTGLRMSELAAVEGRDVIEVPSLRVVVRCGKGGRTGDLAPVLGPARAVVRGAVGREGRLFRTETGRAWTRASVSRAWRGVCDPLGFGSTFHALRRFFATYLLDRGATDLDVSVALRHFDAQGRPNTDLVRTVYGHPSPGAALDRVEALS